MTRLQGKTALVTGASRNIGRAIATRLAADGALVAVHWSSDADAALDTVTSIEKNGGRAFTVRADLETPGAIHQLFFELEQGLKERTGSSSLDILVNNAGVMGGVSPEDTTPEQFDRLVAVNARAPFFILQRATTNLNDGAGDQHLFRFDSRRESARSCVCDDEGRRGATHDAHGQTSRATRYHCEQCCAGDHEERKSGIRYARGRRTDGVVVCLQSGR